MNDGMIEKRLQQFHDDYFSHLPYFVLQTLGYEQDGGLADMFNMNSNYRFDSLFAERAGGDIMDVLVASVGIETIEARQEQLTIAENEIQNWRVPTSPSEDDFIQGGEVAADIILERVTAVFPEASSALSDNHRSDLARFASDYLQHAYNFNWSDMTVDPNTAERMGYSGIRAAAASPDSFTEIALLDPSNTLREGHWVVVTHNGCDPNDPSAGASGVQDTTDVAQALDLYWHEFDLIRVSLPKP